MIRLSRLGGQNSTPHNRFRLVYKVGYSCVTVFQEQTLKIKLTPFPFLIQELALFSYKVLTMNFQVVIWSLRLWVRLKNWTKHGGTTCFIHGCWCSQVFWMGVDERVGVGGSVTALVPASGAFWWFERLTDRF